MVYDLIIALGGFIIGVVIFLLTSEEFKAGKKYLTIIRTILLGLILILILVSFNKQPSFFNFLIIILLTIIVLIAELMFKKRPSLFLVFPYLLIITSYFLLLEPEFMFMLSSLTFLYGLPAGTIFYHDFKKGS